MTGYRVMIADDHPLAREAIRTLLEGEPSLGIVAEATNGQEAIELCKELQPDVILMDIRMPVINGLEATRQIKLLFPQIRVVILSVSVDVADLFSAIQVGAQGYLLKNMDPDDWLIYLKALLGDDTEVSRGMADRLFYQFQQGTPSSAPSPNVLTPREREILIHIAAGFTNRQIAEKLFITEHTVKNHVKHLLEKLALSNRVQLAAYAVQHRLSFAE
jgi:two-component system, NarL family, nitrate/nitrite response regulator NarL